jgi:hypothetical protein
MGESLTSKKGFEHSISKAWKKNIKNTSLLYGFKVSAISCVKLDARNLINIRKIIQKKFLARCKPLLYRSDHTADTVDHKSKNVEYISN